jgi:NAD(P)-dependent dehydrogenase (short-subunit alcohol dehydrogenase family)
MYACTVLLTGWSCCLCACQAVVETNLLSCFMVSREVYRRHMGLPGKGGGSIVNITVANGNGFPM